MSPYRPPIRKVIVRPPQGGASKQLTVTVQPAAKRAMAQPPISRLECMRVARVAKILDVSRKRIYTLIGERRLEVVRVGPRQMRVLKRSLEKYMGRLLEEEAERDY